MQTQINPLFASILSQHGVAAVAPVIDTESPLYLWLTDPKADEYLVGFHQVKQQASPN